VDTSAKDWEECSHANRTASNREDFGLTWNMALETGGLLVGKAARIELSVRAIAQSQAAVA
jgi:polyisoprenoid-binding protein YceI